MNTAIYSLRAYRQKVIAFHPIDVEITGSVTAALLMGQLTYWWDTWNNKEFFQTNEQLCDQTKLGEREFKNAKKRLVELGIISVKIKGVPAKTYYTVNDERILELILELEKKKSSWDERAQLDDTEISVGTKEPSMPVSKGPSIKENIYNNKPLSKGFPQIQKGKSKLPEDIQLSEDWRSYMIAKGIHPTQVNRVWEQFCDHHWSHEERMANWKAALGKWCGNCKEYSKWAFEPDPNGVLIPQETNKPAFGDSFSDKILSKVYDQIGENLFNAWIKDLIIYDSEGPYLNVKVVTNFVRDKIKDRGLSDVIINVARELDPSIRDIKFQC